VVLSHQFNLSYLLVLWHFYLALTAKIKSPPPPPLLRNSDAAVVVPQKTVLQLCRSVAITIKNLFGNANFLFIFRCLAIAYFIFKYSNY
jgi:hypothetical protein